ncbi:MAG: DUF3592 domain-containing protein [bacterium]|nr:DUF3592 domain-containing protein [bacterium]
MSENTSLSKRERTLFYWAFLLMGGLFFLLAFVRPLLKIMNARDWNETSCVVTFSRVKTHDGSKGRSYLVDILYSYEINGKEYRSNRYHFMSGFSSGFSDTAAIVNRYPPGTEITCYVNPKNPRDAIIERGFTSDLLYGLIPLIFMLIGAGGLFQEKRI